MSVRNRDYERGNIKEKKEGEGGWENQMGIESHPVFLEKDKSHHIGKNKVMFLYV